ncbi:DNA polymerase alpha/epsilon subunit B-domain-containing protein [Blastocladiella britannica]|nr:DNA polymerase alpha/epsilon subunit B-domain-containing protein [Blastocladiella britannica]
MTVPPLPTSDAVRGRFGRALADHVVDECIQLCKLFHLSLDDLEAKWEAHTINNNLDQDDLISLEYLDVLRSKLRAEAVSAPRPPPATPGSAYKPGPKTPASVSAAHRPSPLAGKGAPSLAAPAIHMHDSASLISFGQTQTHLMQATQQPGAMLSTPGSGIPFAERTNKGKVEFTHNPHLPNVRTATTPMVLDGPARAGRIQLVENQNLQPFKYMFDKLADLGEAMDDYLDVFEQRFRDAYPGFAELGNPSHQSQASMHVVGRLVLEEGRKIAGDNLVIECSRKFNGVRLRLTLGPGLPFHSLIPGQVIGIRGRNPEGHSFHVERIFHLPLPDPPTSKASDLLESGLSSLPATMLLASGPFTVADNMEFAPLRDLLAHIKHRRPELVVLLGPFIDERNKLVQSGDLDALPEHIFETKVLQPLRSIAKELDSTTEFVLVPSQYDLTHPYVSFPQPPFAAPSGNPGALTGLTVLPNPVQFTWHEMVVAASTRDILLDAVGAEWSTFAEAPPIEGGSDRVHRIVRQVLEQRTFYPLNPPPENSVSIEYSRMAQLELQVAPDLLLLPSHLVHTAKPIQLAFAPVPTTETDAAAAPVPTTSSNGLGDDEPVTLAINPGRMVRGTSGGTVAWVTLHPFAAGALESVVTKAAGDEEAEFVYHAAHKRVRVDIVRI